LRDQDQQFFDFFMLIVGILVGVAVGLFLLVRMIAIDSQGQFVLDDPTVQAEIAERIAPVGSVVLLGAAELEAAPAPTVTPARVETTLTGPQVYNEACYLCHQAPGVGGAPVLGDAAAWAGRLEQGRGVLIEHAINGYQGDAGFMPAKGGRVDLSDDEIESAVDYLIEQLQTGQQ
jgi:cytochrome c5